MQFAECLPDRQAAEAVRSRIDWKYVLGLELTDPGFDHSVLSEFRARLLAGSAQRLAGAVAAAPAPAVVKQVASRATSTVQTVAEQAGKAVTPGPEIARPSPAEVAGRPDEPLPRIEPEGS